MAVIKKNTYAPVAALTREASANLIPYRFVNVAGAACVDAEKALGVPEVAFDAGKFAGLVYLGVVLVEVGTAVTQGQLVTSDALGRVRPQAGAEPVNGLALEAAAPGELVPVLLRAV